MNSLGVWLGLGVHGVRGPTPTQTHPEFSSMFYVHAWQPCMAVTPDIYFIPVLNLTVLKYHSVTLGGGWEGGSTNVHKKRTYKTTQTYL